MLLQEIPITHGYFGRVLRMFVSWVILVSKWLIPPWWMINIYSTGQKYGLNFFRFLKLLQKLDQLVKNVRSVLKMFGQHS